MQRAVGHQGEVGWAMRVRQNAATAAIGAAFLLYFGFVHLAEPTGSDLFGRANWVFYYTLRVGGLAMAAIALWSLIGQRIALAVDAVVAGLIGALLILTGLAMAVDGGEMVQAVINVVCGGMFMSSGKHNWREYRSFSAAGAPTAGVMPTADRLDLARPPRTTLNVRSAVPSPGCGEVRGESLGRHAPAPPPPPPEGFLAALSKKIPPPDADDEGSRT